ncbi:MAG: 50S ribosomal protein L18 [Nanoarchaeota archaeon]|nr:50S ribosomal protein L18 [Nanoarchaeota archaeon]
MKNKRRLKPRTVPYRRKRQQKTDYNKRLKLLISGKARLVVRFTNQRVIAQLVTFDVHGDKVIAGVDSFALRQLGWSFSCKNFPASYLTGFMLAKKVMAQGYKDAILDTGLRSPLHKGKMYAFLKGALDAGLNVPSTADVFPTEDQIQGKHIQNYAAQLKHDHLLYSQKFAQYLKNKVQPEDVVKQFETVKRKIHS